MGLFNRHYPKPPFLLYRYWIYKGFRIMSNSIFADLDCPTKRKISKNTEIQIKWQSQNVKGMYSYHIGDALQEIEDEYNNVWIRTDFICNVCSKFTKGWKG